MLHELCLIQTKVLAQVAAVIGDVSPIQYTFAYIFMFIDYIIHKYRIHTHTHPYFNKLRFLPTAFEHKNVIFYNILAHQTALVTTNYCMTKNNKAALHYY